MRGFLPRDRTGLLVVDVQEKLLSHMHNHRQSIQAIQQAIRGFRVLNMPIVVTEQYPQGLGRTVRGLTDVLDMDQRFHFKTTFSCVGDADVAQNIFSLPVDNWVLVGLEAHVCVLQTAKALLEAGKQVIVLSDAISSRSAHNLSTAIDELRDCGVRVSCAETVLFELVRDSRAIEFKQISNIVR